MTELHWLRPADHWMESIRAIKSSEHPQWSDLIQLATSRLDLTMTGVLDRTFLKFWRDSPPIGLTTKPMRLAVLGSCTVDHLLPSIRVGGLRRNMWITTYTAQYGQYLQELSDPNSGLHQFKPNVVLFALDARHLVGQINGNTTATEAQDIVDSILGRVKNVWQLAKKRFDCQVIHQIALPVLPTLLGHNEERLCGSKAALLARTVNKIRECSTESGIDLLSLDKLIAQDGLDSWHDARFWNKAKHEIRASAAPVYGDHVARLLAAQQGRSFKCLVLDLDNTIWGGVIGDDGLENIVLGQGSSTGEAFVTFQEYARDLSQRGIILAVCSKNDEANAVLPFERHPDMVLKRRDIACFIANWSDKATNLRQIAQRLNIGLDSLVFVDDNPAEREIIRRELPMVAVPELPADPTDYVRCLVAAGYFESITITSEDLQRSVQYQVNSEREALKNTATDLEGYLLDLKMALHWQRFDQIGQQRIVQLINKTNQFNLTTRRYSAAEVGILIDNPDFITLQLRLTDRFGDNGIIAIIIGRRVDSETLHIDSWLMSCRVLGRRVEEACMNVVMQEAARIGVQQVIGEYRPSPKNAMVQDHYARLGFTKLDRSDDATTFWKRSVNGFVAYQVPIAMFHSQPQDQEGAQL